MQGSSGGNNKKSNYFKLYQGNGCGNEEEKEVIEDEECARYTHPTKPHLTRQERAQLKNAPENVGSSDNYDYQHVNTMDQFASLLLAKKEEEEGVINTTQENKLTEQEEPITSYLKQTDDYMSHQNKRGSPFTGDKDSYGIQKSNYTPTSQ